MRGSDQRFIQLVTLVVVTVGVVEIACIVNPTAFLSGGWKGAIFMFAGACYLFDRIRGRPNSFGYMYVDRRSPDWIRYSAEVLSWLLVVIGIWIVLIGGTSHDA